MPQIDPEDDSSYPSRREDDSFSALLDDQRRHWRNGERYLVESYLEQYPRLLADPVARLALIQSEIALRRELGENPQPDEYLRRFPQLSTELGQHFGVPTVSANPPGVSSWPSTTSDPVVAGAEPISEPEPMPSIPGYEIQRLIDSGGQGTVYKARHVSLDRVVALKLLSDDRPTNAERLARFRREGKVIARLEHPHIVRVHDFGESGGRLFLSMEYLPGGTLKDRLGKSGPFEPQAAIELLLTLTDAVEHAHRKGIVHRDLKPGNVLFTLEGQPKIADFGLAKVLDDTSSLQTRTDAILGSPSYMAPEQAAGRISQIGPATDVYALGAILYELLTGRAPFRGESWLHTLDMVRNQPVREPSRLRGGISRSLERVCMRCLEKDPPQRYASAKELGTALEQVTRDEDASLSALDTAKYERIAELANRLDQMWRELGKPIDLNLLLPPAGSPARLFELSELIKTDLEIRWRRKQGVRLDWYVERFQELGTVSELSPRLIYEEYRVRQLHGDKPDLGSYQRRFPRQFAEVERLAEGDPLPTLSPAISTPSAHPPTSPSPMTSNVLSVSGGFRLIKWLGTGAFGEVWLAEAPGGIPVAVKKIYKPVGNDADEHELKALDHIKMLKHPFLLSTHAYWITPEGYLHIAMELADSNLRDRLKVCRYEHLRGVPLDELLRLMNQSAQALDYVHGNGLFHRDMKPDNIMLMNGFAKVGDFGLVRKQGTLGVESGGAGTLAYMAPECFHGLVGKYSDQYSLAITYVELRTKLRPFPTRDNQMAFMLDHKEGTPDLSLLDPVEQPIVLRALAKKPEDRFPTCLAFVQALEKALDGK